MKTNEGKSLLMLVIGIVLGFILACFLYTYGYMGANDRDKELRENESAEQQANNMSSISITQKDASEEEIARSLFTQHLDSYMSTEIAIDERLDEYEIHEITIEKTTPTTFTFLVDYSVKASQSPGLWIAGNGIIEDDGWIAHKGAQVTVSKEGDVYVITNMGTGG